MILETSCHSMGARAGDLLQSNCGNVSPMGRLVTSLDKKVASAGPEQQEKAPKWFGRQWTQKDETRSRFAGYLGSLKTVFWA